MRQYFSNGQPRFDLVLLGLGPEGHTASLFPHSLALTDQQRWVRAVTVPAVPSARLTLTLPVLSQAANAFFLVSGAGKAQALHAALNAATDPMQCPAAGVRLADGALTWWVDEAAAGKHSDKSKDGHEGATEDQDQAPVPQTPIGANVDDSEVSNAGETGKTSDAPRDEERPLHN
jgi:6-phosphogluconolactonase